MSNCGCAGICSCEFDNGATTIYEGNGRIATPFAVHLNDIPYERPVGRYSRRAGSQAISGGVTTQVLYDNNDLVDTEGDVGGGTMDSTFAASTMTVPTGGSGIYLVGGFVEWSVTVAVSTTRSFWIARNGSADVLTRGICGVTNAFGANNRCILQSISGLVSLTAGDVLSAWVVTGEATSIIALDTNVGTLPCWAYMYAQYMGAAS